MNRSDFLPFFSSGFVSPSDTVPHSFVRSHAGTTAARDGPGACSSGLPYPDYLNGNGRISQVPEGPLGVHAVLSDPGKTLAVIVV